MEFLIWGLVELLGGLFSDLLWVDASMRTGKGRVIRTTATGAPVRGPCAYCRKRGGRFVACRACRAPHHPDCAEVNGRCAVYGCANRKFLVPAA